MRLLTIIKFGVMCILLAWVPLLMACGVACINNSATFTLLGLCLGALLDAVLFVVILEYCFPSTLKYARKKEQERELLKSN